MLSGLFKYTPSPHDYPKGTNSLTKLLLTTTQKGQTALQNYSSPLPKRDKQSYKITPHDSPNGTNSLTKLLLTTTQKGQPTLHPD